MTTAITNRSCNDASSIQRLLLVAVTLWLAAGFAPVLAQDTSVPGLIKRVDVLLLEGKIEEAYTTSKAALAKAEASGDLVLMGDAWQCLCETASSHAPDEVEQACRKAYETRLKGLGKDHFNTYLSLASVSTLYLGSEPAKAAELATEAAMNMERLAGTPLELTHTGIAWSLVGLAYKYQGKFIESLPAFDKSIALSTAAGEAGRANLAVPLTEYADTLISLGDFDKAYIMAARAVDVRQTTGGANDPYLADTLGVAGDALRRMGRYDEAEQHFRHQIRIAEAAVPPPDVILARAYQNLGQIYFNTGRFDEAEGLQTKASALLKDKPNGAINLSSIYFDLATIYFSQGELRKAEASAQSAVDTMLTLRDRRFDRTLTYLSQLGHIRFAMGRRDDGMALIDEVVTTRLADSPESGRTADALVLRADLRVDLGDMAGAVSDLEQARKILEPLSPYSTASIRADTLLAQVRLASGDAAQRDDAYRLAVAAAEHQAYVLVRMERIQAATRGFRTPSDRRVIFDTVLDAAWQAQSAPSYQSAPAK